MPRCWRSERRGRCPPTSRSSCARDTGKKPTGSSALRRDDCRRRGVRSVARSPDAAARAAARAGRRGRHTARTVPAPDSRQPPDGRQPPTGRTRSADLGELPIARDEVRPRRLGRRADAGGARSPRPDWRADHRHQARRPEPAFTAAGYADRAWRFSVPDGIARRHRARAPADLNGPGRVTAVFASCSQDTGSSPHVQPGRMNRPRAISTERRAGSRRSAPVQRYCTLWIMSQIGCRWRSWRRWHFPAPALAQSDLQGDLDERHADAVRAAACAGDEGVLHARGSRDRGTSGHRAPEQPHSPAGRRRQRQRGVRRSGYKFVSTRQTSLVVDPPDGRIPIRPEAEKLRDST